MFVNEKCVFSMDRSCSRCLHDENVERDSDAFLFVLFMSLVFFPLSRCSQVSNAFFVVVDFHFSPSSRFFQLSKVMHSAMRPFTFFNVSCSDCNCSTATASNLFSFEWWTKWKIGDGRLCSVMCSNFYCYIFSHSRYLIALALRSNLTVSICTKCGPQYALHCIALPLEKVYTFSILKITSRFSILVSHFLRHDMDDGANAKGKNPVHKN